MKKNRLWSLLMLTAMFAFGGISLASATASANVFQDAANAVEHALGMTSSGGLILAGAVIFAMGITCAVARMPTFGTIIVLVFGVIMCTAFGWIESWVLILIVLFVGGIWAIRFSGIMQGGADGG